MLDAYIKHCGEPQIVVIVLRNENLYARYKAVCYK
jgi:aubergine